MYISKKAKSEAKCKALGLFDEGVRIRVLEHIESILRSGAIEVTEENNDIVGKALLHSALLKVADQLTPRTDEGKEITKNLRFF